MDKKCDLISRAAAIEYLMTNMNWCDEDGYTVDDSDEKRAIITDLVNGIPAVDAVPVVHGWWINMPDRPEWDQKMCSVCGDYFCCQNNYCPNCGAQMDLEENMR